MDTATAISVIRIQLVSYTHFIIIATINFVVIFCLLLFWGIICINTIVLYLMHIQSRIEL
jgi:hypothetical protein